MISVIEVLSEVVRQSQQGEVFALCLVVRTRGSTPQSKGAMMLVLRDGSTLGTLGGGCMEAEVRVRAQKLMSEGQSRLLRFRLDQDYGWDDGLACGGMMEIAVQTISKPGEAIPIQKALQTLEEKSAATLRIEIEDEQSQKGIFEIELSPEPGLLIVGAGHVGRELAAMARRLGWDVTVIDDRPDFASPERFPGAKCVVGDIELTLTRHPINQFVYIVIVTRGHKNDARALAAIVGSGAGYIGLIGSKKKIRTILDQLQSQAVSRELLLRVHAPIGLEIGAQTPAEIAISILAELVAVRHGRDNCSALPMKISEENLNRWLDRER